MEKSAFRNLWKPLKTSVFRGNFENATFKSLQFQAFKLGRHSKKSLEMSFSRCPLYKYLVAIILVMLLANQGASAYVCKYKEDFYKLYHVHYQQLPDDCIENIYWLEQAVKADFANPYYAMAKIEDERQWEKYRYLFMMHVNLKLIEQHLRLGRIYDKKIAYFYDAPWTEEYQRNLEKAQACYEAGYYYWEEAKLWAEKASVSKFNFLCMTDIQYWEDEKERISTGELDYGRTLDRELTRLRKVLDDLIEMNEKKY